MRWGKTTSKYNPLWFSECYCLVPEPAFSVKGQIVNIFGFAVLFTSAVVCESYNVETSGGGCLLIKLYLQTGRGEIAPRAVSLLTLKCNTRLSF